MSRGKTIALCLLVLAGLGFADYLTLSGTSMAETTYDSGAFLRCAKTSLLDPGFYSAIRPPTVPFFYKLVGGNAENIRTFQSALSVFCWFALGLALASLFPSELLRAVILIGTCLFSLSSPINQWDGVIMSESIFLSMMVAFISITIFAVRATILIGRVPIPIAAAWLIISTLFVSSRDSAIYFVVVPWAVAAVWLAMGFVSSRQGEHSVVPRSSVAKALAVGLVLIVASQASLQQSERWRTPLINVILNRVLPNEELYEQWIDLYGLPREPLFEGQANSFAWNRVGNAQQLRKLIKPNYPLASVGRWLRKRGVRSYQRHLLIDEPFRSIREGVNGLNMGFNPISPVGPGIRENSYSKGAGITSWTQAITKVFYFVIPVPLWTCFGATALALACFFLRPNLRAPAVCVLVLLGGAAAQAFVTWHGDAAEVPRHTLVVGVLARVAFGVLAITLIAAVKKRASED